MHKLVRFALIKKTPRIRLQIKEVTRAADFSAGNHLTAKFKQSSTKGGSRHACSLCGFLNRQILLKNSGGEFCETCRDMFASTSELNSARLGRGNSLTLSFADALAFAFNDVGKQMKNKI